MTETNINQAPYYDDFSDNSGFVHVLFKPSVAVQTRELNQLQSILSNQITKFGDNVFKRGTIIKGCNFSFEPKVDYVKILDLEVDGDSVNTSNYNGHFVEGLTTGLRGQIVDVKGGLETQSPDLATLYVKYLNTGSSNQKVFSSTEQLKITNKTTSEEIATVVAAGSTDSATIGTGYRVLVSDGIIYQKGVFVNVSQQSIIIEKYSSLPTDIVVGFEINEEFVTSNQDSSLLDNASGFNNENAPGADRLKYTAVLTAITDTVLLTKENFFVLLEFDDGNIIRRRDRTEFNVIGDELARRTDEESGDYIVSGYPVTIDSHRTDSTKLNAVVGAGVGYVEGYRVQTTNDIRVDINKATDFNTEEDYIVSTNYGSYVIVDNFLGNFDFNTAQSVLLYDTAQTANTSLPATTGALSGTEIGSAKIRSVQYHSGSVGVANTQYRLYLFDVAMDSGASFESVRSIYSDGTKKGVADLILEGSPAKAKLKEFSFSPMIFDIGQTSTKSIRESGGTNNAEYTFRTLNDSLVVSSSSGEVTVTLSTGQWPFGVGVLTTAQKSELLLVSNETQSPYTNGVAIDLSSEVVEVTSTTSMTITLSSPPAADMDATLYFNVKKNNALQLDKDQETVYIKVDAATHSATTTGTYSLGLPDVTDIVGVWKGSTYSESETDVTNQFVLYPNQHDEHYCISYVQKKSTLTIGGSDKLLFKVKCFKKDSSGGGAGFFSINSYAIDVEDIPVYKSEATGKEFNLRDCIDFRLFPANNAAYSTTIGSATENPTATPSFGSSELFIPTPNKTFESDIQFYLPRIDRLVIDRNGNIVVVEGISDYEPVVPISPKDTMTFGEIYVSAFPSLTSREANISNKPLYAVTFNKKANRRYTMRDIGQIDDRISRLEYYSALSLLEQTAKDLSITDENGNDRFKNGIFVDNFNDLISANVKSSEFSCGLDLEESTLIPKFRQTNIPLKVSSSTGVVNNEGAACLTYTSTKLFDQPFASKSRNCVENFYSYEGTSFIFPSFDGFFDTTVSPDFVLDNTEQTPLSDFTTENVNDIFPLQISEIANPITQNQRVPIGDFIRNVSFSPFIRSREIRFLMTGLRPGATHDFYFDGVKVSDNVAKADFREGSTQTLSSLRRTENFGASSGLVADSTGTILGIFLIPQSTFIVGDRLFECADVSAYTDIESATSHAKIIYSAFNFSVDNSPLPVIRPITRVGVLGRETESGGGGGDDPIAQTFIVKSEHNPGNEVVQISKIDVFFKTKSSINGVTLSLRTVENGIPTSTEISNSSKHLTTDQVNTSTTAETATSFEFDFPVTLKTNQEYAIVVKPDANDPDYTIFVAEVGQSDISTATRIIQNWGDGVLFSSTNNRTWTPYQSEDLKFVIYKAVYTSSSGSVTFSSDSPEFLTCNTVTGTFTPREYVFANTSVASAQTISVTASSANVVGTSTVFNSTFTTGDHIVIVSDSTKSVHEIKSIANSTFMTLVEPSRVSNTTAQYFKSVVGKVDTFTDNLLILNQSSAKSGSVFVANTEVQGEDSNAIATIESIDDLNLSYMQPNLYKINYAKTKTTLSANISNSTYSLTNYPLNFGKTKHLIERATIIPSRTNEIANLSGNSGFSFTVNMTTSTTGVSPIVETDQASINTYRYLSNNLTTDEDTNIGLAATKYISKTIQLADNFDADDLKVFLTAYKPSGTDIKVYGKFKHFSDPAPFVDKKWTELSPVSVTNSFSSNVNRTDFKEYEFVVPETDLGDETAFLNSNVLRYVTDNGAIYDGYRLFAIKIVLLSDSYHIVPRVDDIRAISLSA